MRTLAIVFFAVTTCYVGYAVGRTIGRRETASIICNDPDAKVVLNNTTYVCYMR